MRTKVKDEECILHGCTNKKSEGNFIGDICVPCYKIITQGDLKQPSTNFIHKLAKRKSKSKGQLFKGFWISMKDRLPPETDEKILIWIPDSDILAVSIARIARVQQLQVKAGIDLDARMNITGYFATHWMKLYKPEE